MNNKKFLQIIITIIFVLSSSGCEKSDSGGSSSTPQQNEISNSAQIDSYGGVVEVVSGEKKAVAIIPENALEQPENIEITIKNSVPKELPGTNVQAGDCINFKPSGKIFNKKITLGIPYNDTDNDYLVDSTFVDVSKLKIKYFNEELNAWTDMSVKNIDRSANIAYFETTHFSTYITYVDKNDSGVIPDKELVENEYFTGTPYYYSGPNGQKKLRIKGCINHPEYHCDHPWFLNVFMHQKKGLVSVIDRNITFNELTGYHGTISEDGTTIDFDALQIFDKVKKSGDVRLWEWECEFVKEHTNLLNYDVVEDGDTDYIETPDNEKIYADIYPFDGSTLRISWKINIIPEIKPGKTMAIRFEARYKPDGI